MQRFSAGQVVEGKYRIERTIGAGGMGVVFAARHLQLDERLAIKFLLPHIAMQPEAVARFQREARAAVKIKSEHVCRVLDIDVTREGEAYIVMEHLSGENLEDVLQERGRLPVEEAIDYVLQACHAVAEAHSRNIVHRDLKPSNLFCTRHPNGAPLIKVLDFGVSKLMMPQKKDDELTATNAMMGSFAYVSPEQLENPREVDHRTDIWSLGVILQQLVTGRLPFDAPTPTELVRKIKLAPPEPLGEQRQDVPTGLASVILRCLEKDRTRRFPDIARFAVALSPFAHSSRNIVTSIVGVTETLAQDRQAELEMPLHMPTVTDEPTTSPHYDYRQSRPPIEVEATVVGGFMPGDRFASPSPMPLPPTPHMASAMQAPSPSPYAAEQPRYGSDPPRYGSEPPPPALFESQPPQSPYGMPLRASEQPPPSLAIPGPASSMVRRTSRARRVAVLGALLVTVIGVAGVAAVRGWQLPIPFLGASEETEPEIVDVSEPEEEEPSDSTEGIDSAAVETPIMSAPSAVSAPPNAKPSVRPRKRPKPSPSATPSAPASASSSAFPPKTRL
jgi:serine/threonine-protein kinase